MPIDRYRKRPGTKRLNTGDTINAGLQGIWLLNEGVGTSVADLTANANTGTLIASPTWASSLFGKSLLLNGNGDYINVGTGASLQPTTAITVSAWFNSKGENAGATAQTIVDHRLTSGTLNQDGWTLQFNTAGGANTCRFFIWDTAFRGGGTYVGGFNQWYHFLGTWDKTTGVLDVYVNGVLRDHFTGFTSSIVYGAGDITRIGSANPSTGGTLNEYLNGRVDNVRIYNRFLYAYEVVRLYRNPFAGISPQMGVSALTFNGVDSVSAATTFIPIIGHGPGMSLAHVGGGLAGRANA